MGFIGSWGLVRFMNTDLRRAYKGEKFPQVREVQHSDGERASNTATPMK